MDRRKFLFATVAAGATAAFFKPGNLGAPYDPYFSHLNTDLKDKGLATPNMLVDLDKLDHNIAELQKIFNPKADYRIVAKSLPSPKLLGYIMDKAQTNRLMLFHQPFLNEIAKTYPKSDVLIGKPMPVKAAQRYYQLQQENAEFNNSTQLQWLIDSKERLEQYLSLAKELNTLMQINVEIDVGLHRGGLQQASNLTPLLDIIAKHPEHLKFSGFMGYDPQIVKIPSILKSPEEAYQESQAIYQSFIDQLYSFDSHYKQQNLCFNAAGSPTIALHKDKTVANELAAGSCLVKPVDFDIPTLAGFIPASFIATPVLKKMTGTKLPAAEFAKDLLSWWDPNMEETFFIYGGKWMAQYESPRGLQGNGLFGRSTNQEIVNASTNVDLNVDDNVFLRPTQSEFVFLQFGDLVTLRHQQITHYWPTLGQGSKA